MSEWTKIEDGENWRWRWGDWTSAAFSYLEERPWTPTVIAGRLCFSARNGTRWCVVWGDDAGPWYDDVMNIVACADQPLYVARNNGGWFLVWHRRASRPVDRQITYTIADGVPFVQTFDPRRGRIGPLIAPDWMSDDDDAGGK